MTPLSAHTVGDACDQQVTEVLHSSGYYKLQVFLLVVLLLVALFLIATVFFMIKKVRMYRQEAAYDYR